MDQPTNQPTDRPTNQPTNQPNKQGTSLSNNKQGPRKKQKHRIPIIAHSKNTSKLATRQMFDHLKKNKKKDSNWEDKAFRTEPCVSPEAIDRYMGSSAQMVRLCPRDPSYSCFIFVFQCMPIDHVTQLRHPSRPLEAPYPAKDG